ncbi:MAG: heat-inducible transcriptional repressor HrcA [Acidobacteriota bacterium]
MDRHPLSGRGAAVLDAVVERYILTGEPVSSAAISRALPEKVSSATVRNVMAELERLGYLQQPHTSAGRMPTRRGYERYVSALMTEGRLEELDERRLRSRLEVEPLEIAEVLRRTCRALAELSQLVGVVMAPPLADTVVQHIDFVRLEGDRVLVTLVARSGQVENRIVSLDAPLSQEQLDRAGEYLVRRFAGRTLREVARRIRELREQAGERMEEHQRRAIELGARYFSREVEEADLLVEGTASLLGQPDFDERQDLQQVLEVIEDHHELARLLASRRDDDEPQVLIGTGELPSGLGGCSLITASYSSGERAGGAVAVLGPRRLQYARAISLVRAVARTTSSLFREIGR